MDGGSTGPKESVLMPRGPAPAGLMQWVQDVRISVSFLGGCNAQPAVKTTIHYVGAGLQLAAWSQNHWAAYDTSPELRSSTSNCHTHFTAWQTGTEALVPERPARDSGMSESEALGPNHI